MLVLLRDATSARAGVEAYDRYLGFPLSRGSSWVGAFLSTTKKGFLPLAIKKRGNIARKGSILLIPPLYATIAREGISLTEMFSWSDTGHTETNPFKKVFPLLNTTVGA